MSNVLDFVVRKYKPEDREAVRKICTDSALMGRWGSLFFEGDDILADVLTLYFTDFEPESCFVAEAGGRVIGYLIGAKNTSRIERVFLVKILPELIIKTVLSGVFLKKKNIILMLCLLRSFIKGEFKQPGFFNLYPATLHINIQEGYRNLGAGSRLIQAYLGYLEQEKIRGVQFATMSEKAFFFFSEQGFSVLFHSSRSYFRHLLHKDVPLYIFGKKLGDGEEPARVMAKG